jgi:hypothetical protein
MTQGMAMKQVNGVDLQGFGYDDVKAMLTDRPCKLYFSSPDGNIPGAAPVVVAAPAMSTQDLKTSNIGKYQVGQQVDLPHAGISGYVVRIEPNTPGASSGPGLIVISPYPPRLDACTPVLLQPTVISSVVEFPNGESPVVELPNGESPPMHQYGCSLRRCGCACSCTQKSTSSSNLATSVECSPGNKDGLLFGAAADGDTAKIKALLKAGANAEIMIHHKGANGAARNPLIMAACKGHTAAVEALLQFDANSLNAKDSHGFTALMHATIEGHSDVIDALLLAGADAHVKSSTGQTAADLAQIREQPFILAKLDPKYASEQAAALRKSFTDARVVHVLSTRYNTPFDHPQAPDPKSWANHVKHFLETGTDSLGNPIDQPSIEQQGPAPSTKVFNPNSDNAFLMGGNKRDANDIWLLNWREHLELSKRTGGKMIQIVVCPDLSNMQQAEESMAHDKGVPVVKFDVQGIDESQAHFSTFLQQLRSAMDAEQKRTTTQPPNGPCEILVLSR